MFDLASKFVILSLFDNSVNRHVTMANGHLNSLVFLTVFLWFLGFGQRAKFFWFGVINVLVSG